MPKKEFIGNQKEGKIFFTESGECLKNLSKIVKYSGFYVSCNGNIMKKMDCNEKCNENCGRFTQRVVKEDDVEEIKKDFKIEVW